VSLRTATGGRGLFCYLLKLSTHQFSARLDVGNVTNATALTLSSQYLATPQLGRNYTLILAADL